MASIEDGMESPYAVRIEGRNGPYVVVHRFALRVVAGPFTSFHEAAVEAAQIEAARNNPATETCETGRN